jgi:hypothetical protein
MSDDQPITLAEAAADFFGGRLSASSLRAEARRGNLVVFRIGRTDFTTVRNLRDMTDKCRVVPPARVFTLTKDEAHGRLETERVSSARAAALEAVAMLRNASRNTSGRSISPRRLPTRS